MNSQYFIAAPPWDPGLDLQILDLSTGEATDLNAQTYLLANTFAFPYWSPDGSRIVFSSSGLNEAGDDPPLPIPLPFELWILRNVTF